MVVGKFLEEVQLQKEYEYFQENGNYSMLKAGEILVSATWAEKVAQFYDANILVIYTIVALLEYIIKMPNHKN